MSELRTNKFFLKKLYQSAKFNDLDKDGVISRADYDRLFKAYSDLGASEEAKRKLSEAIYAISDSLGLTDHTKSLTYDEIVKSWVDNVVEGKGFAVDAYDMAFRVIDRDGNGSISLEEWEFHNKALNISAEHARAPFEAMDTNQDGKISHEEFVAYHFEYFHTSEDKLHSSILHGPLE